MTDSVEVQAFLICDSVMRDSQTGKFIINGVFERVWAPAFPVGLPQLSAYFRIRVENKASPHTVALSLASPSGVREKMPPLGLAVSPNGIAEGSINIMGFPFHSPGEYRIELLIDDTIVAGFTLVAAVLATKPSVTGGSNVAN